jgi:hypothetical protein
MRKRDMGSFHGCGNKIFAHTRMINCHKISFDDNHAIKAVCEMYYFDYEYNFTNINITGLNCVHHKFWI